MPQTRIEPATIHKPVGQYSHAVRASGEFLFIAGQVAIDPAGQIVGRGDYGAQCEQILKNISAILEAAGASIANIVKMNYYITDMSGADAVRAVRARFFGDHRPASTFVAVTALVNPDLLLEVEAVAVLE